MERTERVTFPHITVHPHTRIPSKKGVKNNLKGTRKKLKRKLYAKASEKSLGKKAVIICNKGKTIILD